MAKEVIEDIRKYYESQNEIDRWQSQQLEFEMTRRFFDRNLKPGSSILELGAGAGFYTTYLAQQGHQVTAIELSDKLSQTSIEVSEKVGLTEKIEHIVGDAREVTALVDSQFDAILVMGPFYHLQNSKERSQLLGDCKGLLKPNGQIYSSFLTRIGLVSYMLYKYPNWIVNNHKDAVSVWQKGRNYSHPKDGSFRGYFFNLEQIISIHDENDLNLEILFSQDPGIGGNDKLFNELDESTKSAWIEYLFETASDPLVLGSGRSILVKSHI